MDGLASEDFTADTFFEGRIRVWQHRRGYRFSIDSILLAHYAAAGGGENVLDLGTGCGIIPLVLAYRNPKAHILGVELQPELAELAQRNIARNRLEDRISILHADFRNLRQSDLPEPGAGRIGHAGAAPVDLVVSNPPYRPAHSGRINPDSQKAVARHEIAATLKDVIGTARNILEISGRLVVVHLAERATDLLCEMRSAGIEPKRLRMIHSRRGESAKRILVEAKKGGRPGITVGPPLMIYRSDGGYTGEVNRMLLP